MKILKRNARAFWYCRFEEKRAVMSADGYETGEKRVLYRKPVKTFGNVSPVTGAAQTEQFGTLGGYDKVIVMDDVNCPIDENTVLFVDKEPEFDDRENPLYDYTVLRVAKSLNSVSIAISKVDVS